MSGYGTLSFFVENKPEDLPGVLARVLALCGAPHFTSAMLGATEDRTWKEWQREMNGMDADFETAQPADGGFRQGTLGLDEIVALSRVVPFVHTSMLTNTLGRTICRAVLESIPVAISDRAILGDPSITIGGEDFVEELHTSPPRAHFHGRGQLSFHLSGPGSPSNWNEYKKLIWQVPEIVKLQQDLEVILGPLKRCIIWSV